MADFNSQPHIRSQSLPNILSNIEEDHDVTEQPLETSPPAKVDLNTLKNEIITDGMQVSVIHKIHLVIVLICRACTCS